MSRAYHMDLTVASYDPARKGEVMRAARRIWPFRDWSQHGKEAELHVGADDTLYAGRTPEDLAKALRDAVWAANGAPCYVRLLSTCLEDLPYDVHEFEPEEPQE